jgi:hypothetical protein
MSTQPFSSIETATPKPFTTEATEATEEHRDLPKSPQLPKLPGLENQHSQATSVLDGPWKIRVLPESPKLPPGVLPAPEPHAPKSLPWRRGDVTRLKDDSPKGMMEYIATHTRGWWQELAERALRDNDKAERMAREAGWQPGQYWSLEVDAEAKQKLLEAEEARRQREEAERAKERAEKEAFMQRQMELLKKAGKAPRCEFVYTDGRGCRAPQVKGERWCHGHARMMSYRPEKLELEPMEDEQAVMVNLYRVTKSLLAGRITEKTAGLMLWSVAIGMPGARRLPQRAQRQRRKTRNNSPQMDTDERRSENKFSRESTRMKTNTAHRGGAETRRKTRRRLPLMNADERGSGNKLSHESTRMNRNNPGVTNDKSFVSGVDRGSRGLPEMPKVPKIAESETMHSSASPRLRGEPSHSIRVHPRQSAVSSCSSSVAPCLRGEDELQTTKDTKQHGALPERRLQEKKISSASPRLRGGIEELQKRQGGL